MTPSVAPNSIDRGRVLPRVYVKSAEVLRTQQPFSDPLGALPPVEKGMPTTRRDRPDHWTSESRVGKRNCK